MSGTIWLITEDQNDYKTVKAIVRALNISVNIQWRSPSSQTPGLSRLAAELKDLIALTRKACTGNDCIVVLHDADEHRQPVRNHYNKIRDICSEEKVKLIVAHDELEAWLLSDSGVCAWLGEKVKTWNGNAHPSDHLRSVMQKRYNMKYPRRLEDVLKRVKGDSTNQSFQAALKALKQAPCMK